MIGNMFWDSRPNVSPPAAIKTKSPAFKGKTCGSNWGKVEIRVPYKNVNTFKETLEKIPGTRSSLVSAKGDGLYGAVRNLRSLGKSGTISRLIDDAEDLVAKYDIRGSNRSAIEGYIGRAKEYLARATVLWEWWDTVYVPGPSPENADTAVTMNTMGQSTELIGTMFNEAPNWSLGLRHYRGRSCVWPSIGHSEKSFACPFPHEATQHALDADLFRRLVIAAINNARCAAEAAASVGVYYKNKAKSDSTLTIQYAPRAAPSTPPPVIGEPLPEPPPEELPPEEPKKTAKKKDNTLLIAGAAVLALLAMKK